MITDTRPPNALSKRIREFFAKMTESLEQAYASLPKMGQTMYRHLLRLTPPNRSIEFDLEDFQDWTEEKLGHRYSLKWVQIQIRKLAAVGLVRIDRILGRGFKTVKLTVLDPTRPPKLDRKSEFEIESSQKQPSNPYGAVLCSRDIREQQHPPTTHVVVEQTIKRESSQEDEGLHPCLKNASQGQPILGEEKSSAAAALQALDVRLNRHVRKLLERYDVDAIARAIAAVKAVPQRKNPTGLFIAALKRGWEPPPEEKHPLQDKIFTAAPPSEEPTTQEQASNLRQLSQIVRSKVKRAGRDIRRLADLIGVSQQPAPIPNNTCIAAPPSGLEPIGSSLNPYLSSG